jgi:hypothetical protein
VYQLTAGEHRDLFAPEPDRAAACAGGEADIGGGERGPTGAKELGEIGATGHVPIVIATMGGVGGFPSPRMRTHCRRRPNRGPVV